MAFRGQKRAATGPGGERRRGGSTLQIPTRRRKSAESPAGRSLNQPGGQEAGLLQPASSLMERGDGARCPWRSASVCAVFVGNVCFFLASLAVLLLSLTKPQSPPPQPSSAAASQVSAAHLVLKLNGNTSLNRGTLDWFYRDIEGAFLGPSFEYSFQKLKIKEDGLYRIYAQINVTRRSYFNGNNKTMNADFYIHHNHESNPALLTLTLNLSATVKESYTNSISQIYQLSSNDTLYGTLKGSTEEDSNWALQNSGNFFGVVGINKKETVQKI